MVRAFSIAFKHCCGAHTVWWTVALRRPKRSVDHAVNMSPYLGIVNVMFVCRDIPKLIYVC